MTYRSLMSSYGAKEFHLIDEKTKEEIASDVVIPDDAYVVDWKVRNGVVTAVIAKNDDGTFVHINEVLSTLDEAIQMVEAIDDILKKANAIVQPKDDFVEASTLLLEDKNDECVLYGSTYADILYSIENDLIDIFEKRRYKRCVAGELNFKSQ